MVDVGTPIAALPSEPLTREAVRELTRHDKIGVATPVILREDGDVFELVISGTDWIYGLQYTDADGWVVEYERTGERITPDSKFFQEAKSAVKSSVSSKQT